MKVKWRGQEWSVGEVDCALATAVSAVEDSRTCVGESGFGEALEHVERAQEILGRAKAILVEMQKKNTKASIV